MSWQAALIGGCMLFTGFCAIVAIFSKPPKRPQATRRIHLPRETLWSRTNKYHGDTH